MENGEWRMENGDLRIAILLFYIVAFELDAELS